MKTSENLKKTFLEVSCYIFINAYFYGSVQKDTENIWKEKNVDDNMDWCGCEKRIMHANCRSYFVQNC